MLLDAVTVASGTERASALFLLLEEPQEGPATPLDAVTLASGTTERSLKHITILGGFGAAGASCDAPGRCNSI